MVGGVLILAITTPGLRLPDVHADSTLRKNRDMKPVVILKSVFMISLMFASSFIHGGDAHTDGATKSGSAVEALSPALRTLLSSEMQALQSGMMSVIPAYVSGNWHEIAHIAGQIKNSYILKQNLTDEQMHELHTTLPADFVNQDQKFHYYAGMLEHAAKNRKVELVGFYYSRMAEACVSCHTQYAGHKFPELGSSEVAAEHKH